MAERKKTPNILGDLLGGAPTPPLTSKPERRQDDLPAKQQDSLIEKQDVAPTAKPKSAASGKSQAAKPAKKQAVLTAKQLEGENNGGQDDKPVSRKASETIKQEDVLPAKQETALLSIDGPTSGVGEDGEEEIGAKVKVTFYLSEDAVEFLEDSQSRLRKLNRSAGRKRGKSFTSKSAILEEAVRLVCSELEEKGMESQLARLLL